MALSSRPYANRYVPSSRFPAGTKWLLIITSAISILFLLANRVPSASFLYLLLLRPEFVIHNLAIWQLVTYMFVHAGILHLVWNMLALWMFGAELERTWSTPRFLRFYFACGIIPAIAATVASAIWGFNGYLPLGASEAVLGLLVGYAVMFPDNTLLFGFLIPMKSKYFVMIIAAVVVFQSLTTAPALIAHVVALLCGYVLLRGKFLYSRANLLAADSYKDWKMRRAKRKFEVYLRKNDSRRDRTLH